MVTNNVEFWLALDKLVATSELIIDRPKGSVHPRYSNLKYEVNYGYLNGTKSMDNAGVDVWRGSLDTGYLNAIICVVDLLKGDSEIKLLIGCTKQEQDWIYSFHNKHNTMKGLLIERNTMID